MHLDESELIASTAFTNCRAVPIHRVQEAWPDLLNRIQLGGMRGKKENDHPVVENQLVALSKLLRTMSGGVI